MNGKEWMNEGNDKFLKSLMDEHKTMMGRSDILYLALHQHGNVNKHVMQLLDAAFQTNDVFVSGFNLAQGLFRDARVHNLHRGEASVI